MPVVEIASFVASEALLADHDLLKDALEHVSKTDGFLRYVKSRPFVCHTEVYFLGSARMPACRLKIRRLRTSP